MTIAANFSGIFTHETSDFILPVLWPSSSPDLNPYDYKIWNNAAAIRRGSVVM